MEKNNRCLSSRLIAFFTMLAMMLSMCTPIVWAADDILNGAVSVSGVPNNGSIETLDQKVLIGEFEYGNQDGSAQADARIYFGNSLDKITLTNFPSMTVGAKYGPYTIQYDSAMDEYYIAVSGITAGETESFAFTFKFNQNVIDGDSITFKLYNGNEAVSAELGEYTEYTVYAEADADWAVAKNANPSYIKLSNGATTLANNNSNATAITYTITEAEVDGSNSSSLSTGEAAIYSYTSYDTIELPAGMYISAGSDVNAAIKAAYTISGIDYSITDIKYDENQNITGFTAYWTENNADAESGAAMEKHEYTATLDATKVNVSPSYSVGTVKNAVYTDYVTKTMEGGTVTDRHHSTNVASTETDISVDGNGLGSAVKKIEEISSATGSYWGWNNSVNGYVTEGDTILYSIVIRNNSEKEQTYTVTDLLSEYNLESVVITEDRWNKSNPYTLDANQSFKVTIPANGEKTIYLFTKVKEDKDFTITNKATIALSNGVSLDTTAQDVPQKVKTPDLAISKTVEGLADGTVYENGDEFYYVITVTNTGKGEAEQINISDLLPSDVEYISHEATGVNVTAGSSSEAALLSDEEVSDEATQEPAATPTAEPTAVPTAEPTPTPTPVPDYISGTVTNLGAGQSATIRVKVKAKTDSTASSITNTANATLVDNGTTKSASVTITKHTAAVNKLTVSKTADKSGAVYPGDTITYTITVQNPYGSGTLSNATFNVKDVLPDGLEYVSDTASTVGGTTTVENGNVNVAFNNVTIANNGTITFTVTCKVPDTATADSNYNNKVVIVDTDGTEHNSSTHTGITGGGTSSNSSILIEKDALVNGVSIDGGAVAPGTEITYTLKITNKGNETLSDFTVADTLSGSYENNWGWIDIKLKVDELSSGVVWQNGYKYNHSVSITDVSVNDYIGFSISTSGFDIVSKEYYTKYDENNIDIGTNGNSYNDAYLYGLSIPANGYIVLSYTLTTATDFTGGSNTVVATASDGTTSNDVVRYTVAEVTPTPEVTVDPNATPEPTAAPSSQLTITKTAEKTAKTVSDTDATTAKNEIDKYRFKYTVSVKNTTGAAYTTNNMSLTDVLPAGFALSVYYSGWWGNPYSDDTTVQVYVSDRWGNKTYYTTSDTNVHNSSLSISTDEMEISSSPLTTLQTINPDYYIKDQWGNTIVNPVLKYKADGSTLSISFANEMTIPEGGSVDFTYYLTPTDAEVQSIYEEMVANGNEADFIDRYYKNEATFSGDKAFYDAKGAIVTSTTAVETVEIISPKIHPGIEKTALYGISASDDEHNITIGETDLSRNDIFVWKVTIYNAKDHAGGGKTLNGYKVTDAYPQHYKYGGKTYTNGKYSYDATWTAYNEWGQVTATGTGDSYIEPDENGVFDFSDPKYAIPAGGRVEFTVITTPDMVGDELTPYGLYTNTVTLELVQEYEKSNVISGTVLENKTIQASDTIPLYLVSTSSSKAVELKDENGNVSESASSNSSALGNYIGTTMGDTVTYTLEVKNHDQVNYLEDFAIIDRLPAEDDIGVITDTERGSAFPLTYAGNVKAIVTLNGADKDPSNDVKIDVTQYLNTSFAYSADAVFEPGDIDWLDTATARSAATRVTWLAESSASTNLIRFCLSKLSSYVGENPFAKQYTDSNDVTYTKYGIPPKATIDISFDAKVPSYVQDAGEGNYAWNSFAYYFNSDIAENMVAEPGKVGLWADDTTTGGSILVRKNYSTNMPGEEVTFYFALFDGEYVEGNFDNLVDTAYITMTGTESGSYAETYFMNIDYKNSVTGGMYYIYETDANYVPLKADSVTTETQTFYVKDSNGENTDQTIEKTVVTSKVVDHDGYDFVMDNSAQIKQAMAKYSDVEYEGEVAPYNTDYLVWHKDINANKTYNTAIFTNSYEAGVNTRIMGPFYADVPTDKSVSTDYMTSTRPDSFKEGTIENVQASNVRDEGNYAADATYGTTAQYGGDQKHTIATGFLALLESEGTFTLEQAKWNITTSVPNESKAGVYVRLRTESSNAAEGASLMYLDDFDVVETESGEELELGAVGGFDDIMDDETFVSDYTVEERAEMIAESLGIDPANVEYDENGLPYVVMDEELQNEAFAFSEAASGTTSSDFVKGDTELLDSGFADGTATAGYVIYKLKGTAQYTIELNDNIPHLTMTSGAKAYVGIVIDQLYDQNATATLELSDEVSYDDTMITAATAASEKNYTKVVSPFQKGGFSIGALMKLTAGKPMYFDNFVEETTKTTSSLVNANNTMKITATNGKNITVNVNDAENTYSYYGWKGDTVEEMSYKTYLGLNGSGRKDYRSIVVNVDAGAKLRFIASSTGDDERTLVIEDSAGNKQTVVAPAKSAADPTAALESQVVTVETAGAVYIYSAGSGINVYSVELVK